MYQQSEFGRRLQSIRSSPQKSRPLHNGSSDIVDNRGSSSSSTEAHASSVERFASMLAGPSSSATASTSATTVNGSSNGSRPRQRDETDRSAIHSSPQKISSTNGRSRHSSPHASLLERPRTPSKRTTIYADRYIPARDSLDGQTAAFQRLDGSPSTPQRQQKRKMAPEMDAQQEEADHAFASLLGSEIFGDTMSAGGPSGSSSSAPSSGGRSGSRVSTTTPGTPTKKNLFSFSSPSGSRSNSVGTPHRRGSGRDDTLRGELRSGPTTPRDSRGSGEGLFGTAKKSSNTVVESLDSANHRAFDTSPVRLESQKILLSPRRAPRTVSKVPFKVLDAPDLADDFYLNLVDWSSNDVLGVGLDRCVYLWSAKDSNVQKLVDLEKSDDKVTSLSWAGRGSHISVGTRSGLVQIWDVEHMKLLRTMRGHTARVGALAWNEHILTSGSRDRTIYHRDVRVPEHHIRELHGHKQEVCNLEWNTEMNQLASGGNDNKLLVWDSLESTPLHRFTEHNAAVKAIAWSPHQQGILASGGGTADMKIRFWNTLSGQLLHEVDTGSQVCQLMWSRTANELISTHGYSAGKVQNQIQLWRYPTMQQIATLTGHTFRVLYLAMSPDGETIVTGAGDETLRFWDLNTASKGQKRRSVQDGVLNPFAKLR